jgi:proteic killer suppression protein
MQKQWGDKMARKLQQRMAELKAADTIADISHLPPPRCHALTNDRAGQFSVDLLHPYRLLFIPANDPIPLRVDGGINLLCVTEIEIIEIEDTH